VGGDGDSAGEDEGEDDVVECGVAVEGGEPPGLLPLPPLPPTLSNALLSGDSDMGEEESPGDVGVRNGCKNGDVPFEPGDGPEGACGFNGMPPPLFSSSSSLSSLMRLNGCDGDVRIFHPCVSCDCCAERRVDPDDGTRAVTEP